MKQLQHFFEGLVKEELSQYNNNYYYKNIDVFEFWNVVKKDEIFKRFILKRDFEDYSYRTLTTTHRIIEKAKHNGLVIISSWFNGTPISSHLLINYVNFVVRLIILFNEYIWFYKNIENQFTPTYFNIILDENNENLNCVINIDIT